MAAPGEDWLDADIAAMEIGYGEKAGLQIYRNYTKTFEKHAIKHFVETLNLEKIDLKSYQRVIVLLLSEEARFLPVIVCAFADDLLIEAFKAAVPDSVPGGKSSLLKGYGPLADFSKRIKMAFAFDVMSPDLMEDLDRLRAVRNRISHAWDHATLGDFLVESRLAEMTRVEEMLSGREELRVEFSASLQPLAAFRIRLVWIIGRLVYEAAAYTRAKKANLRPTQALYGLPRARWLKEVAGMALSASKEIVEKQTIL